MLPFSLLPEVDAKTLAAIEAVAEEANDRYLVEIVEEHGLCPYSRPGRAMGQTARWVRYASSEDIDAWLAPILQAASSDKVVVVQAIFPMLQVAPEDWIAFGNTLTKIGNERIGQGSDMFAVAAFHPELAYSTINPQAVVPLFRRSPDPTLQWIRLDTLESLYAGRTGDTEIVDPADLAAFDSQEQEAPLFERITEANMQTATRLGLAALEAALKEIATSTQDRYAKLVPASF